jgi:hypothetical protein
VQNGGVIAAPVTEVQSDTSPTVPHAGNVTQPVRQSGKVVQAKSTLSPSEMPLQL